MLDRQLRPTPDYLAATDGSLRDIEYRIRTDADGYILPPPVDLDGVTDRIIFFGDSFVESIYVPEEHRFVVEVQSILRDAGQPVRCLNAGYSGATSLHMLLALIGKVGRCPATTIVLVIPSNDAFALIKKGGFWCREDKRYSPVVPVPDGMKVSSQPLDLTDFRATLNLFIDTCHRFRLRLLLATFPHRTADFNTDNWLQRRFNNFDNYERVKELRRSVNAVARSISKRLNTPLVDLEMLVSTQTNWFYDDLHMNEAGSKGVAHIIGDALLNQL